MHSILLLLRVTILRFQGTYVVAFVDLIWSSLRLCHCVCREDVVVLKSEVVVQEQSRKDRCQLASRFRLGKLLRLGGYPSMIERTHQMGRSCRIAGDFGHGASQRVGLSSPESHTVDCT